MRTRMPGAAEAGGKNPRATRLCDYSFKMELAHRHHHMEPCHLLN